jgi:hypothetical protein
VGTSSSKKGGLRTILTIVLAMNPDDVRVRAMVTVEVEKSLVCDVGQTAT